MFIEYTSTTIFLLYLWFGESHEQLDDTIQETYIDFESIYNITFKIIFFVYFGIKEVNWRFRYNSVDVDCESMLYANFCMVTPKWVANQIVKAIYICEHAHCRSDVFA